MQAQGVEVVQFDFLTPEAVAAYCQERGFLQCLWECGGKLAAPAIAGGAIHKAMAFIAPKIVSPAWTPTSAARHCPAAYQPVTAPREACCYGSLIFMIVGNHFDFCRETIQKAAQ